jgi:hypothetical protein
MRRPRKLWSGAASTGIGVLLASVAWVGASTADRAQATTAVAQIEPSDVSFSVEPTDTVADELITPAVQVKVSDAYGTAVANRPVTLALAGGESGAVLEGTTSQQTGSDGVAVFGDLSIDRPGTGYRLVATAGFDMLEQPGAPEPPSAESGPFSVLASPAPRPPPPPAPGQPSGTATLAFVQQPTSVSAGAVMSPPVLVQLQGGDTYSAGQIITLKLLGNTGAALHGTVSAPTVGGVATFAQLSIRRAGTGYRLIASTGNAADAQSGVFSVWPGPAAKLAFTRQPGNGTEHQELSRQPQISVQDQYGNRPDSAVSVALRAAAPEGLPAGGLSCVGGASQRTRHGVATFSGCRLDQAGDGYRLIATSPELAEAKSAPFDIEQAAAGGGGSLWPVALAGVGALALLAASAAGVHLLRQHRLGLQAKRTRAVPHPDAGTVELADAEPVRAHAVRLEPHTDRAPPHLREEP